MGVVIIAEAGVNHNGSLDLAKKLVDEAAKAGVDYVKFQTFKTELNISKGTKKAKYQIDNSQDKDESQFEMVKKLELDFEEFLELENYCKKKNIGFLSTGFDYPSIDFLDKLNIDFFKVPSGEVTNKPLLEYIAKKNKPIVLSTGMADLEEINKAISIFIKNGVSIDKITILHCNTEYPTPFEDVNLRAMNSIKRELGVKVGYSDHTLGIEVPVAAVALGAEVIEKHFTLDNNMVGPDRKCSLEPNQLKDMVLAIRNIEKAISGSGVKKPSDSELRNINIVRKSLHLRDDLPSNTVIKNEHLIALRPGDGISPMEIEKVIGKRLKIEKKAFSKLDLTDIT